MSQFSLIMISAMYENGGNTTHRMLDGHPELFPYPFESQLGTSAVNDYLSSYVPFRYRYPEFAMNGTPESDYEAFYDEELKTLLRVPGRSKFRDCGMILPEAKRRAAFVEYLAARPRTRRSIVEAFYHSTFAAWENLNRTGMEHYWLGYSPVIVLDAERFFQDFPEGHMIHVVRNPYSGYADTKKRPFPISLVRYGWTWNYCQHLALTYAEKYPKNFNLLRFEDLVADPRAAMDGLCKRLGIATSDRCYYPSFNGVKLEQVYPWGTIRTPTPEANIATMNELSAAEKAEMKAQTIVMQRLLGYDKFA